MKINLKNFEQKIFMKWLFYQRGTIYPHAADMFLRGVLAYSEKLAAGFVSTLYINLGPKLFWSWNKADMDRLIKVVLEKISDQQKCRAHLRQLVMIGRRAISAADRLRRVNLKTLSNQKLIEQYSRLDKTSLPANGLLGVEVDAIDLGFENFFIKALGRTTGLKGGALVDLYKKISRPLYQSYIIQQEKAILQLALRSQTPVKAIDGIYQKFWWTKLGWENIIPHTRRNFQQSILSHRKSGKQALKNQLNAIDSQLKIVSQERQEIIARYKLGKNILHYLQVIDQYSLIHDLRKECQVKSIYVYYLLMREIGRRLKLKSADLEWLLRREVQALLRGKQLDKKEIERRKKAIAILVNKNGMKIWSGQPALDLCKKELKLENQKTRQTKGMGVTSGKIQGRAKICQGAVEAMQKIKSKKDILICPMTLPDYAPAMKRAAAIVTDEGGITCHAAIISRELGLPCIVGTKIATQVFHDGDRVEVDANRGIVKKLK